MEHEYPQYYEVQDPMGEPFAMVCVEHEHSVVVVQPRQIANSFIITKLESLAAVGTIAPGEMLGVHCAEFEEVVLRKWRLFNLSQEVMNATVAAGYDVKQKEEPDARDIKPDTVGDADVSEADTVGGELSEQPADDGPQGEESDGLGTVADTGTGDDAAETEPESDAGGDSKDVLPADEAETV